MSGATSWSQGRFCSRRGRVSRVRVARPFRQRRFRRAGDSRTAKKRSRSSGRRRVDASVAVHHSHRTVERRAAAPAAATEPPPVKLASLLGPLISPDAFGEIPHGQMAVVTGRSGDHPSVYQTLINVFQGPSRDEFQSQIEDPFYEPLDRLLVRRGHRVLSHLHLTRRTMRFGQVNLPMAGVQWLATLPEFRSQGFASRLLLEAERRIVADGGLLAAARTSIPHFFARSGWAVCGRHSVSRGEARLVLAGLQNEHADQLARPLSIRLWRQVEMPALMRIYRQNTAATPGPLERSEAYWRWLVGRKAYDALFVAIDGRDRLELDEATAPIVGYAALRQGRVVELMTSPDHPTADVQLLARACAESVERDRRDLFVHAPCEHRLHRLVELGGGSYRHAESDQGETMMIKIIDPPKLLAALAPELESRAKQAEFRRGAELGLQVGAAKWRIVYTQRGIRVRSGPLGRHYLAMNRPELTRLILGHGSVRETAAAGRIQASTRASLDLADVLLPKLPLWRPVWDDLAAG